ncbi:MAG TPA: DNA internalization-related competence protein ComEC/Rec2 [Candidatus Brocadiia bacterium]|nr:DNA internalization-related competence protein ComEC/Rec2 [Planctomycetota bacterium]MDO8092949.1 DNA internalization-related competence protein ComEC/Rec2 [Candidatus Brocadiales bacterium]
MNRHPLVGVCGAFALGILLDYSFNIPISFLLVLTFISLLSFPILFYLGAPLSFCVVSSFLLIGMTGASYHHYSYSHYPINHISRLLTAEKKPAYLQGIVVSSPTIKQLPRRGVVTPPQQTMQQSSFLLKADMIKNKAKWERVSGTIRVSSYTNPPEADAIKYGNKIELLGTISAPLPPNNPGQWDYRRYLQRQQPSITALMTVTNLSNIKVLSRNNGNAFFRFVNFIKERLAKIINRCCTSDSSSIVIGMILGDRQNISNDVMEAFKKTGTIHFLAISGFNVGILVIAVHTLLRMLGINRRISAGAMILFLMLYAILTGMVPSAVRACLMASIYFGAILLNRGRDLPNSIAAAVLIILIRNPSELFSIGLQLSVLGVLGIVYVSNRIEGFLWKGTLLIERLQAPEERSKLGFLWRYIRKNLCVSLGAWLAVMPLIAHYFHILTPFVALLNIIIFPLICILVVGGLVILIVGSIHPLLTVPFAYLIHYSNLILEWLIETLARPVHSTGVPQLTFFYTPGPSWLWISIYYAMGITLIWYKEMRLRLAYVIILMLVCGNVFFFLNQVQDRFWNGFGQRNKDLRLTCLSVGHGSAVFIEFPNGKNLLFDAGSYANFDVGESIIAPFLWERGIKKIDLVVLSHEHTDHTNALPSLLERFRIDAVLTNKFFLQSYYNSLSSNKATDGIASPSARNDSMQEQRRFSVIARSVSDEAISNERNVLKVLKDKGIKHFVVSLGTRINGFGEAELMVLGPPQNSILSSNDNSCVLRIGYAGRTLLLLADVKEAGIASLLYNFDNLKADIIQVPHHGFYIANTNKLVKKVQPHYAFINSDTKTVSEKTLNEYLENGTQVFRTDHSGAITVTINSHGIINVSTFIKR